MEEINQTDSLKKDAINNFLPISILVAAVLVSGSIIYAVNKGNTSQNAQNNPKNQLAAVNAPGIPAASENEVILGNPNAPVSIIEYSDYQCPFCVRFFETVEPNLREEYIKTNKVKMVYRNLAFLGPESLAAAEAAECAKDQNKFWMYHDALFNAELKDGKENNGNLNRDLFIKLAKDAQLDIGSFAACIDSQKYVDAVKNEVAAAQKAGVNSTPITFINGQMIRGAQPYSQFKAAIDNFLTAK